VHVIILHVAVANLLGGSDY